MSKMIISMAALVPLTTVGFAVESSGRAPTSGASEGQAITIVIGAEPSTLDPQLREDGGEVAVNDNVYEALLALSPEAELYPLLAADMPTSIGENQWEIDIRPGIEFHNGEPLDAAAVAASFNRMIDPEFASEQTSYFETIASVEAVDDDTIVITTHAPDPVLPSRLPWIKVVPPEHSQSGTFAESPVGTGPYRFVEWNRGQDIVLEANEDYWGETQPTIGQVTYRFVPDAGSRISGLVAGEFDLITNLLPEHLEQAPQSAQVVGVEHAYILLNSMEGVLADPQVREALNLAVDQETIAEALYGGFARPQTCQLSSPEFFGYNEELEVTAYDPDRARELLQAAGAEGATITLTGTSGRWLKDRELTEAVANYWTEVGLNVDLQIFQFSEYLDRLFDSSTRPQAIFLSSSNELLDASNLRTVMHRDALLAGNDDAELAELIDAAEVELDVDTRADLYDQALALACDENYFTFLVNLPDVYGMSERLVWEPRIDGRMFVNDMELAE